MTDKELLEHAKNDVIAWCEKRIKETTNNDSIFALLDLREKLINGDCDESIMKHIQSQKK